MKDSTWTRRDGVCAGEWRGEGRLRHKGLRTTEDRSLELYKRFRSGAGKTLKSFFISSNSRFAYINQPEVLRVLGGDDGRDDLHLEQLGMGQSGFLLLFRQADEDRRYWVANRNLSLSEEGCIDDTARPGQGLLIADSARVPITDDFPKGNDLYDMLQPRRCRVRRLLRRCLHHAGGHAHDRRQRIRGSALRQGGHLLRQGGHGPHGLRPRHRGARRNRHLRCHHHRGRERRAAE